MAAKNHPRKGSTLTVEPITSLEAITAIRFLLKDRPRDLALFVVGINTALRAGDLLALTVGQAREILAGGERGAAIREQKTGKVRRLVFNRACREVLTGPGGILDGPGLDEAGPLFFGRRGRMTPSWLNRLVKGWCRAVGLRGRYGTHTLRKTWGYHQRVSFGVDIPTLMTVFGHATQRQTLTYLCVQPEEVRGVYANVL